MMKRAISISMASLFLILLYSLVLNVYGITIEQGNKDLVFYCHNATNGKLLGTAATINATNSASSVTLATQVMTNQNTGKFNITVNLAPDTYILQIDCGNADNLDYTRTLYVDNKRQGLVSNALNSSTLDSTAVSELNQSVGQVTGAVNSVTTGVTVTTNNDKNGYSLTPNSINDTTVTAAVRVGLISNAVNTSTTSSATIVTAGTVSDKMGYGLTGNAVNSSTLSATGTVIATVTDVTNAVTVGTNNDKTGYTLSAAGIQSVTQNISKNLSSDHGSGTWTTATGFSTPADLSSMSGSVNRTVGAIDGNASNWFTSTHQNRLLEAMTGISQNASNWFTSTYQTRLDAAITTRSSHSAADVDNLIGDEQIQQALDGNASNWFTSSYQTNLDRVNSALSGNASNWFTSTYQTRVDAAITTRSSHSAADVWSSATRTLTNFMSVALNSTGISGVTHAVTQNVSSNLSTDHGTGSWASATGFVTPADLFTLSNTTNRTGVALSGNASNWFTSTYQTNLDATISSRASSADLSAVGEDVNTSLTNQNTLSTQISNTNTSIITEVNNVTGEVWNAATRTLTGFGTLAADVWTSTTRTLTNFASVAINSSGVHSITQNVSVNLSTDHGSGLWDNTTSASLSSIDKNEIIRGSWQNVSSNLTTDHSAGNWSATTNSIDWSNVANTTLSANATNFTATRWTIAWYLHKIYTKP